MTTPVLSTLPARVRATYLPDGSRLDCIGMVLCRQRPGTASGVTFFSPENETGFVHLIQ